MSGSAVRLCLVLVASLLAVVVLAGCGGSEATDATPTPDPAAMASAVLTDCVQRWNGNVKMFGDTERAFLVTPTDYVSVGISASHPDRCLITASNLDVNYAAQFLQDNVWFRQISPEYLPASALSGSVTDWNARMDASGRISPT